MKKRVLKHVGLLLIAMIILTGNLIGIRALATDYGTIEKDVPPDGVLVGYTPLTEKVRTGEHLEYWGWIGAPFARLVIDYGYTHCCNRTYREMDGCKGLPICATR